MEDKFIATLYKRIELSDNVFIFKREGVIKDAEIDLINDMYPLTYYDGEKRVELYSIDSIYVVASDSEYYYGYALDYETLKEDYNEIESEEELIDAYLNDLSPVINIGYYNEEKDHWKLVITNEEQLEKFDDTSIFNMFVISYDSNDEERIIMPVSYISKMLDCLKEKNYAYLEDRLIELNNGIYTTNEQLKEYFNYDTKTDIKYEQKEEVKNKNNIDDILKELNNLVGLKNIKNEVKKLLIYLKFKEKAEKYLDLEKPNLHMFFTGNPGTGKTTVARIISKLFYEMGYLKSSKVAETTPKDLIAEYVGQTAIKTANFINQNKGGVIFIDEAYVFSSDSNKFANEALVEILKELEKNETVFIFAGYKEEMKRFIDMNPGLESRVGYYLNYEDYTKEELLNIFEAKINKMGFIIEEELKQKIEKLIEKEKETKNFGNGRYIDKLINKIILEHSVNTEKYKRKKELITLTKNDLPENINESLSFKVKKKNMGFGG